MTQQATPRPWRLTIHPGLTEILADEIPKGALRPVPVVSWPGFDDSFRSRAQHRANAALIVQAVNAYDDMLAALQGIVRGCTCPPDVAEVYEHGREVPCLTQGQVYRDVLAAIAKATGN